jgi:PBP1b-binding outer membrane lipoprotein LpoB
MKTTSIAALLLASLGLVGCSQEQPAAPAAPVTVAYRVVTYRVHATDDVDVSYPNSTNGMDTEVAYKYSTWEKKMVVLSGSMAYVTAQLKHGYGTVHAEILVDGKVIDSSESTGEYQIAKASAVIRAQ